jgi:6,7-dimethyl-8-ribityllumazine synthase
MLTQVKTHSIRFKGGQFAIVASRYNEIYVEAMLKAARTEMKRVGAKVEVIRVPGAFEIPVAAAALARTKLYSAVVCLGVILRGATVHAQHIGDSVSRALMRIQVETEVPMIHEVLLLESVDQARVRCLDPKHNRGTEAAQTALQMAQVMTSLRKRKPKAQ